ncbi:hypothetical protein ABS735_04285 [Streptomyces sp. MMCC 100]|uniref:hypothetical protein n=1 Tax=Streptomyces sp. MMCC 100 TaxID=3163555 RepID=UPI003598E9DE
MTRPRPDTGPSLPPVAPEVLAAAVESLTTRLRGRLDAAVEALAATPVDVTEDGTYGVRCGEDAWVTLTPGPSGTITAPDQARCTCLLSPRCLHRAAALGTAPAANATPPAGLVRPAGPVVDASQPAELDRPADPAPPAGLVRPAGRVVDASLPADLDRPAHPTSPAGRVVDGSQPAELDRPADPAPPAGLVRPAGRVVDASLPADLDRPAGRVVDASLPADLDRPAGRVVDASLPADLDRPAHPTPPAGPVADVSQPAELDRPADPVPPVGLDRPTEPASSAVSPAPTAEPAFPTAEPASPTTEPASPAAQGRRPSADQVRAAADLWTAAAAVLAAGVTAAGAVLRAELLRAAHTARLAGLHRAEGAALDVVRRVREAHDPHGAHDGHRPSELVAALRELLLVTHRLKAADPDPELIGAVHHNHRPDGPLRLYGVCREPVVGPGGLGGVVTHLVGDDGRWYTLRDVRPGGAERARRAGSAHVAVRSFLSDHERLSRGGLIVTGAVVAPDGRLLAEPGVRATFAAGRPWTRAVRSPASAAAAPGGTGHAPPLTGCDVEILAADGEEVLVRVLTGDVPGPAVRLAPAHRHPALAHTVNLRRLGACPGLRVRVLGRVDPDRVTVLRPLAVGPVSGTGATTLRLPEEWRDRADLGYDQLGDGHFPSEAPCPAPPVRPDAVARPADSPLRRVRDLVELAVTGGRRAAAEPARDSDRHGHAAALRRGGFGTGADLFTALGAVAARRPRDAFGRLARDDQDHYAAQWLATAVYLAGTEAALGRGLWRG